MAPLEFRSSGKGVGVSVGVGEGVGEGTVVAVGEAVGVGSAPMRGSWQATPKRRTTPNPSKKETALMPGRITSGITAVNKRFVGLGVVSLW